MNNKKDPLVYVVQDPDGKEIAGARIYGEIRVILTGRESMTQAIESLTKGLKNFTENDYLLLVGRSINMGLAVHFALCQTGGVLNLLVWHREHWAYTKETINTYDSTSKSPDTTTINRKRIIKNRIFG